MNESYAVSLKRPTSIQPAAAGRQGGAVPKESDCRWGRLAGYALHA